ncbi:MAG: cytochrome c oxidase subunit II [Phycisphaerae bacterium]
MNRRAWLMKTMRLAGLLTGFTWGGDARAAGSAGWWLPENASAHGGRIDALFTLIFVVTVATMILVFAFLAYLLVKYRHRAGRRVAYVHGNHRLEVLWTLTPAVMLVVMGILSLRVWADVSLNPPDSSGDVTEVEVLAQQFQWNVRYPGKDRRFGTPDDFYTFDPKHEVKSLLPNRVTVPVGRPVKIYLMSKDVLHSFFLPHMRMKRDAVPGLRGVIYFTPTRTGRFDLACAELCGPQHYSMAGMFEVLSQEQYDAWYQERLDEVAEQIGEPAAEEPTTEEPASSEPAAEEGKTQEGKADEADEPKQEEPADTRPADGATQ